MALSVATASGAEISASNQTKASEYALLLEKSWIISVIYIYIYVYVCVLLFTHDLQKKYGRANNKYRKYVDGQAQDCSNSSVLAMK